MFGADGDCLPSASLEEVEEAVGIETDDQKGSGKNKSGDLFAERQIRDASGVRHCWTLEGLAEGAEHVDGADDHAPESEDGGDLDASKGAAFVRFES